jgi:hypothetical protein
MIEWRKFAIILCLVALTTTLVMVVTGRAKATQKISYEHARVVRSNTGLPWMRQPQDPPSLSAAHTTFLLVQLEDERIVLVAYPAGFRCTPKVGQTLCISLRSGWAGGMTEVHLANALSCAP